MPKNKKYKKIFNDTYIHINYLSSIENELKSKIKKYLFLWDEDERVNVNIIKINEKNNEISFLYYHDFFDQVFHELRKSWKINIKDENLVIRDFTQS